MEVTRENIDYCKNLMKVLDLRHLDNLRGNFMLYENKYYFIYDANISHQKGKKGKKENDKKLDLLLGSNSTPEIVDQQQKFFDTIWDNSIPAYIKVKELEDCEKGTFQNNNIISNNFRDRAFEPHSNSNVDNLQNTVRIIRDKQHSEYLLLSSVYNASTEVLLTTSSVGYFKHLWKIGLEESLKQAIGQGARIIILYPENRNKEIIDKDILYLISDIKDHIKLESITGTMGSVLIVDSSKILLLSGEEEEESEKEVEESAESNNSDIRGVYSNNKSIVNNYGALFDTLLNEKEVLRYVAKVKDQLEISHKQLTESNLKLKINSELQKEFIILTAHELRTPTQAIVGYIEMIENYPDDSSDNQNYLKSIVRNANRLERLVEDLLDVVRIESRTMTLSKEVTNLEHLINTVVQDFRVNIKNKKRIEDNRKDNNNREDEDEVGNNKKKNIEIITSLNLNQGNNKTGLNVMVDRNKIIQAISNIIGNSLNSINSDKKNMDIDSNYVSIIIAKSMNKDSKKWNNDSIPKENKKNEILVTIKDTGRGIDSKILPRLFTKFATNMYSGTGLGLYITKAIIEAHGGKLWAENNQNENGATFRFTLPLV